MDILWYSLKVAVVGMLVVFVGLIILIGCIKALSFLSRGRNAPPSGNSAPAGMPPAEAPAPAPAPPTRTYTPGPMLTRKDDALYAVISAAVARVLEDEGVNPEGGFVIRAVEAINEMRPGPPITPKDEAFYAVITATIAQVLEAEGINPEGGFVIRSIEPA